MKRAPGSLASNVAAFLAESTRMISSFMPPPNGIAGPPRRTAFLCGKVLSAGLRPAGICAQHSGPSQISTVLIPQSIIDNRLSMR
jgi:hypothetical protein